MRHLTTVVALVVLVAGCGAKAKPTGDAGGGPDAPGGGGSDGPPGGGGPVADGAAALDLRPPPAGADGGRDGAPGTGVPALDGAAAADRGARIPQPPPGKPPCAPDAMAVHDGRCPYPVVVACRPNIASRPQHVCYCFAPPSSGKWVCQDELDGGGSVGIGAATDAR